MRQLLLQFAMLSGLLVVEMVSGSNSARAAIITWEIADGGNGHAFELVTETRTWQDAMIAAQARTAPAGFGSGHLLTISDVNEYIFIGNTFGALITAQVGAPNTDGAWIGFTDSQTEGEWRWIDNTVGIWQDPDNFATPIQTAFVFWDGAAEANDTPPGEDYAVFRGNGRWNDYFNTASSPLYLVEFEPTPVPEPASLAIWGSIGLIGLVAGYRRRGKQSI